MQNGFIGWFTVEMLRRRLYKKTLRRCPESVSRFFGVEAVYTLAAFFYNIWEAESRFQSDRPI